MSLWWDFTLPATLIAEKLKISCQPSSIITYFSDQISEAERVVFNFLQQMRRHMTFINK